MSICRKQQACTRFRFKRNICYALKVAHGAFILYPGTEDEIFYLDEEPSHRDLLYGVGAFKLGPGRKSDFTHIRYYVEKLLKLYRKKEKE